MIKDIEPDERARTELIVQNWFRELEWLVPE